MNSLLRQHGFVTFDIVCGVPVPHVNLIQITPALSFCQLVKDSRILLDLPVQLHLVKCRERID